MTGDRVISLLGLTPTVAPLSNWPDKDIKFLVSEEVKEIGDQLIAKFRPDLRIYNICYLFRQKAPKSGETITLGTAQKQNDKQRVLHGYEAIIEIGYDAWVEASDDEKYRLVFHELEHLGIDENGKIGIVHHPVEEFPSVIRIFGPGNDAQIEFISAYNKFTNFLNNGQTLVTKEEVDEE